MDLSKFQNIVRRYLWLFVLVPLVASLTTALVVRNQPRSYRATTRLLVGPSLESPSPDLNSLRIGGQLTQTYAEMVDSRTFLESVNNKLDHKTEVEILNKMITTRQNIETRVLTIIVYHPDPIQAVAIAKAAAETFIEISPSKDNTTDLLRSQMTNQAQQLEEIVGKSEATIQQLESELAELKSVRVQRASNLERQNLITRQLAEERAHWTDALRTLTNVYQILINTNTNQLEIIEPAGAVLPVNKDIPLKSAMSGFAGLILAVVIAFVFEYFDDTIRSPQDLSRAGRILLLSKVERHKRLNGSGLERLVALSQPSSRAANSYRTAVSKLLFSIGHTIPYTILLSNVGSKTGDDTATATANLAVAFAQAGHRVVVVDAQLRHPVLTRLFEADTEVGLSDFLTSNAEKIQLIFFKEVPGFQFLPAGLSSEEGLAAALNPAKIARAIEELQKEASIVLIAGSSISSSAESLTLASQVNGVVLVARQGEARLKIVNEVIENLNAINVQVTGIIYDENPSSLVSKQKRDSASVIRRVAPEIAPGRILETTGQVGINPTPPSDLTVVAIPADETIGMTRLDQVEIETIADDLIRFEEGTIASAQLEDLEAVARPTDENTELPTPDQVDADIRVLEEAAAALDQAEDLEPAVMPTEENTLLPLSDQVDVDIMGFEEGTIASAQLEDLEAVAMPTPDQVDADITILEEAAATLDQEEDLEPAAMPTPDQVDADITILEEAAATLDQEEDLEPAAMPTEGNLELLHSDRVEVGSAQSPDAHNTALLSQEDLELATLDTNGKKPKANRSKNPNGSHKTSQTAPLDTNGKKPKASHSKNPSGSPRASHRKSSSHS